MTPKQEKEFLNKLRQPIHINYISKYILRCGENETKKILENYISKDLIEESKLGKGYFGLKQN